MPNSYIQFNFLRQQHEAHLKMRSYSDDKLGELHQFADQTISMNNLAVQITHLGLNLAESTE